MVSNVTLMFLMLTINHAMQVAAWTAHPFVINNKLEFTFLMTKEQDSVDSRSSPPQSNSKELEQEWGVSCIGGDSCGSKYNDDPFDAASTKPGLPDNMKARIEAMAEQKLKEAAKSEDDEQHGEEERPHWHEAEVGAAVKRHK